MIRFWGQPKYQPTTGKLIGYELFLREYDPVSGQWRLPADFSRFTAAQTATLLAATLATLPSDLSLVSFNLDQQQFVDPAFRARITAVAQTLPFRLIVELTEREGVGGADVSLAALVDAAARYAGVGLAVCLDDVGTGANQSALVAALDPYTMEYKYALQNVRGKLPEAAIQAQVRDWHDRAQAAHKLFAMEGFEDRADVALIQAFRPDVVQGYNCGKPHELPIAADFGLTESPALDA